MEFDDVVRLFQDWGVWISAASVLMLVSSVFAASFVVVRIPVDYFSHHEPQHIFPKGSNPFSALMLSCVRNVLGMILLLLGVIMLFTPGQGLLCILLGLLCMDFPGKLHMERRIISNPMILAAINKLRHQRGKPPLTQPHNPDA